MNHETTASQPTTCDRCGEKSGHSIGCTNLSWHTASQPKVASIGDDAQFIRLLNEWHWAETDADVKKAYEAITAHILSFHAPAAQASATIQAAPEYAVLYLVKGNKGGWWESGKDAYDNAADWNRKIVYTPSATIQEPVMVVEPVNDVSDYKLAAGEKIFFSRLSLSRDGLPLMTDSDIHGVWDIAMVFKPTHTRPSEVFREKFYCRATKPAAPMVADPAGVEVDFREKFKDAYDALKVAAFDSPFWNQSMEQLLSVIDSELTRRTALAATVKAVPSEALEHAQQMQGARGIISTLSLSLEAFMTAYDEGDAPDSEQEAALQAAATDAYKWLITDVKACMVRDKLIRDAAPLTDKTGGGE